MPPSLLDHLSIAFRGYSDVSLTDELNAKHVQMEKDEDRLRRSGTDPANSYLLKKDRIYVNALERRIKNGEKTLRIHKGERFHHKILGL